MMNDPSQRRSLVTVATYNERENLPRLVEAVFAALPTTHVLVVDDNSPDGTGQWCKERAQLDRRVHCLHRAGKLGLGTATIAAMQYAISQGYEYMLNLDADFSHPPERLPALLEAMEQAGGAADVAVGSRYIPGGGIEGWSLARHFMSRGVNLYSRLLLRLPTRDCSGAFRCYRVATLARLNLALVRSRGYSFQEEILWRLNRAGARLVEVPFVFVDRRQGESKIDFGEMLSALGIIARLGLEGLFRRSPGARR